MRYDCGSTAPILEYTVVGKKKNKAGNEQNQNFICGKFFQVLQLIFQRNFRDFSILRIFETYLA